MNYEKQFSFKVNQRFEGEINTVIFKDEFAYELTEHAVYCFTEELKKLSTLDTVDVEINYWDKVLKSNTRKIKFIKALKNEIDHLISKQWLEDEIYDRYYNYSLADFKEYFK